VNVMNIRQRYRRRGVNCASASDKFRTIINKSNRRCSTRWCKCEK